MPRNDLGDLSIIATPIGNLGDITERALHALRDADAILCEDTRHTRELLTHFGISRPLERLDAHSDDRAIRGFVSKMASGAKFALVSDAGTPSIADPGARLVHAARAEGVRVTPLPGPSAVTALASVLGAGTHAEEGDSSYCFCGFFPREFSDEDANRIHVGVTQGIKRWIWFESPHRIVSTVESLARHFSAEGAESDAPRCVVAKELTKLHEKIWDGILPEISKKIAQEVSEQGARGEWSFALIFPVATQRTEIVDEANLVSEWSRTLKCLIDAQVSASEAARAVSQEFGVRKRDVYEAALKLSGKK